MDQYRTPPTTVVAAVPDHRRRMNHRRHGPCWPAIGMRPLRRPSLHRHHEALLPPACVGTRPSHHAATGRAERPSSPPREAVPARADTAARGRRGPPPPAPGLRPAAPSGSGEVGEEGRKGAGATRFRVPSSVAHGRYARRGKKRLAPVPVCPELNIKQLDQYPFPSLTLRRTESYRSACSPLFHGRAEMITTAGYAPSHQLSSSRDPCPTPPPLPYINQRYHP